MHDVTNGNWHPPFFRGTMRVKSTLTSCQELSHYLVCTEINPWLPTIEASLFVPEDPHNTTALSLLYIGYMAPQATMNNYLSREPISWAIVITCTYPHLGFYFGPFQREHPLPYISCEVSKRLPVHTAVLAQSCSTYKYCT